MLDAIITALTDPQTIAALVSGFVGGFIALFTLGQKKIDKFVEKTKTDLDDKVWNQVKSAVKIELKKRLD